MVIPPNPTCTNPYPWDRTMYRARNVIERMYCRFKDLRRGAARCDRRADTHLSLVLLTATAAWWLNGVPTLGATTVDQPKGTDM